jgi:hypothetical protein
MGVVEGTPVAGKAKPSTWEDARAGFEPGQLVRGNRSLTVEYRHHGDRWTATSPDLDDFEVSAPTLPELKTAVNAVLNNWLDPAVEVKAVEIDETRSEEAKSSEQSQRSKSRTKAGTWMKVRAAAAITWHRTSPRPEAADHRRPRHQD